MSEQKPDRVREIIRAAAAAAGPVELVDAKHRKETSETVLIVYHLSNVRGDAPDYPQLTDVNIVCTEKLTQFDDIDDSQSMFEFAGSNAFHIGTAFGGRSMSWTIVRAGCSIRDAIRDAGHADRLDSDFVYADNRVVSEMRDARDALHHALHEAGIDPFENWEGLSENPEPAP